MPPMMHQRSMMPPPMSTSSFIPHIPAAEPNDMGLGLTNVYLKLLANG
jgi:hypothetical protein